MLVKSCLYRLLECYTLDYGFREGAPVRQWIDDLAVTVGGSFRHVRRVMTGAIVPLGEGLKAQSLELAGKTGIVASTWASTQAIVSDLRRANYVVKPHEVGADLGIDVCLGRKIWKPR